MRTVRIILTVLLGLAAALMLYVTLTIPAIAAAGPAILFVALAAVTWFVVPKRPKVASKDRGDDALLS